MFHPTAKYFLLFLVQLSWSIFNLPFPIVPNKTAIPYPGWNWNLNLFCLFFPFWVGVILLSLLLWSPTNVSALLYQIFRILGIMILSLITLPFKLIASSQILLPPLGRMPFILQLVHLTMFRPSFKFNRKNGSAVLYRATLGLIIFLSICRCITANVSVLLYQLFVKVWVMICPCQFFQNHLFLADSVILVQNCDFHFPFRISQCFAILLNTAEKRWFVGWRLPEFPPSLFIPSRHLSNSFFFLFSLCVFGPFHHLI